jgi:transcriptional regulator with XRE-family HTH domain
MTEQEFFQAIGRKIKEFRKQKDMTQAEVAEIAKVNRGAIANLEAKGNGIKSADIIRRIVEATGHSMADVFVSAVSDSPPEKNCGCY